VQNSQNAASIALYQSQTYQLLQLLNSTTAEVASLGAYLLGKYMNPVVRFTGVSCELAALTSAQWSILFAIDLTSIVTVQKDYSTGSPASESQTLIISGVEHRIVPGSHLVNFTMESTDGNQYFTLNDTIFGTLSTVNLLSF